MQGEGRGFESHLLHTMEPKFYSVRRTWQILAKDEAEAAREAIAEGRLVLLEVEEVPVFHFEEQTS